DIYSFGCVLYEMFTGARVSAGRRRVPSPKLERIVSRCLEKDPGRRWQSAAELEGELAGVSPAGSRGKRMVAAAAGSRWRWLAAASAGLLVLLAAWWLRPTSRIEPPLKLRRLTSDAGLSRSPALSPDGKLVAYTSDRALDGQQDLYVQQVSGGQPIRLTFDGAETPNFSPDGSRIVFRSNRDGGGIYQIPVFG